MMSTLASLVVRRRRAVILIWIVLLIGAGTIGSSAFSDPHPPTKPTATIGATSD